MKLILGNIAYMDTDAIVIPAHTDLKPAPGISEAVFCAADAEQLSAACRQIGRCRIGQAVITSSYGLKSRYIIHVAGPGWYSGHKTDRMIFADCYLRALQKAQAYHCRSVALPLMFSGEFHIPRAQALLLACRLISQFEAYHPELKISLVLYKESIYHLTQKVLDHMNTIKND